MTAVLPSSAAHTCTSCEVSWVPSARYLDEYGPERDRCWCCQERTGEPLLTPMHVAIRRWSQWTLI